MKKTTIVINPEDPKSLRNALHGVFTEMQSSFTEMLPKVPEALRPSLTALKTRTDEMLAGLASRPTEQVPAAQEAAWSLDRLVSSLAFLQEQYQGAASVITELTNRYTPMASELQSFKDQQTKGELLAASEVEKREKAAVEKAIKEEREKQKILATRRTELQTAKLPVPGDEVIEGEEKVFTAVKKTAEDRLKKLTELGATDALQGAELVDVLFGKEADYSRTVKLAERFSGERAGGAERGAGSGEPLAGGSGGGGAAAKKARAF